MSALILEVALGILLVLVVSAILATEAQISESSSRTTVLTVLRFMFSEMLFMFSSTHVHLENEDLSTPVDDYMTEDISFDPFKPRTYKASCNFKAGDEGHIYNDNIFTENTFTTSQLLSIELYDIVTSFNDHDKLSKEYSPEILRAGPVNTLLKNKAAIKPHAYDICVNACKLYNNTQNKEECPHCDSKRFMEATDDTLAHLVLVKTMKMMSLGNQLARLLSNSDTRKKLHYRANRQLISSDLSDYFDGEEYRALKTQHLFQSPDNVAVALFLDGFVNQKKSKQQLTIVHAMILNYDPLIRYINEYLIQLVIIPRKSVDLDSFLLSIIAEVISLGKYELIIKKFDGERIAAKVHIVMASGDIPQVTKYCHHKDHNYRYGCYICEVLGEAPLRGRDMYFKNCCAPLRPMIDFVNGNPNTSIQESNIFAQLPTFTGSSFYSLDEMHLIGHGVRAINYIDFLLYAIPTLLVPLFSKAATRKALLALSLNEELIVEMENHFSIWHQFLQVEISKNSLSISVFSLVNHYLTHIGYITRKMRNLRVYNTRSMERTIGRYSKLIKSRVFSGEYAGNLVERLAIRGYLNCAFNIEQQLNLIKPYRTSLDDYLKLPLPSPHEQNHRLWSLFESIPYIKEFTNLLTFTKELQTYYTKSNSHQTDPQYTMNTIEIAACALIGSHVYGSEMYRRKRSEFRRGNHYIQFHAIYQNCRQFLVLVSVMNDHSAMDYDYFIPVGTLETASIYQRLVVISLNDIQNQVGLVQTAVDSTKYKVVTPYYIFNEDMKSTAGKLRYIKL
ncbi:hypothetical protein PHYBLDRAFT_174069 [Phycomyces blakesleeanus NRRL 1555(-)]|uniref:Transposase domain-containing protein n=1 Tax=Phycomyces blakesleeanus (strain ATCC 8743b / DSM 1359 / FGSC 10004 / NBRC 33097 / NRRL 1555) TaxID=763407 RepID=A0A162ZM36_PHYB8|nr:hypothetical protein PHYBLDRAFT_174069 [Phycomyces blakesleeanus NRRL 1555(-)]OAD67741.1 hypothetical protein PHYBLDRAFT_174069 [Phycomyces blakesleeanus NRRL 1555(-)]|eukprot:XP_018285781.1 hypothetical protein PHYBLDRAFT_174069 [Phycomyces blakesleeanus NRRL 1555(-)]